MKFGLGVEGRVLRGVFCRVGEEVTGGSKRLHDGGVRDWSLGTVRRSAVTRK